MPGPKAIVIHLSEEAVISLTKLIKAHQTGQQIVLRARIILAAGQGRSNARITRELGVQVDTVRLWRNRWQVLEPIPLSDLSVAERLEDLPRLGLPPPNAVKSRGWPVKSRRVQTARLATGRVGK